MPYILHIINIQQLYLNFCKNIFVKQNHEKNRVVLDIEVETIHDSQADIFVSVDGKEIKLDKNTKDDIDVVVDRLIIKDGIRSRLFEALETASKLSGGKVVIDVVGKDEIVLSENFACPHCDYSLPELEPRIFSFNAPYGACEECKGLGIKLQIDKDLLIPDETLSIAEGCIKTLTDDPEGLDYKKLECVCKHYKINMTKPWKSLSEKQQQMILYGSDEIISFKYQ